MAHVTLTPMLKFKQVAFTEFSSFLLDTEFKVRVGKGYSIVDKLLFISSRGPKGHSEQLPYQWVQHGLSVNT